MAGTLSFFPSKNLGGYGDGGMVLTRDADLAEHLRTLRVHGRRPDGTRLSVGGNFRLDTLQAAVLLVKLEHLEEWTEARRSNAERYATLFDKAGLSPEPVVLPEPGPGRHVYNQYVVRVPQRDALRKHLLKQRIGTGIYYEKPLHLESCLRSPSQPPAELPRAERAAAEVLALPIYPELGETRQRRVVEAIGRFYAA